MTPDWLGLPDKPAGRRAWGPAVQLEQRGPGSHGGIGDLTWRISSCGRCPRTVPAMCLVNPLHAATLLRPLGSEATEPRPTCRHRDASRPTSLPSGGGHSGTRRSAQAWPGATVAQQRSTPTSSTPLTATAPGANSTRSCTGRGRRVELAAYASLYPRGPRPRRLATWRAGRDVRR